MEPEITRINLKVPKHVHAWLKRNAAVRGVTINHVIIQAIEKHIQSESTELSISAILEHLQKEQDQLDEML